MADDTRTLGTPVRSTGTGPGVAPGPVVIPRLRGVLHATFAWNREDFFLHLWLETSMTGQSLDRVPLAQMRVPAGVLTHPRCGTPDAWETATSRLLPLLADYEASLRIVGEDSPGWMLGVFYLPSESGDRHLPVPSPLLREKAPAGALPIRPFVTAGRACRVESLAFPLLRMQEEADGYAASPGLAWLAQVARLAALLWVRGDAVPTVRPASDGWWGTRMDALWRPLLDDPVVRERLEILAEHMPGELLAGLRPTDWPGSGDANRWILMTDLLGAMLDAMARLRADRRGRAKRIAKARVRYRNAHRQSLAWEEIAHALKAVPNEVMASSQPLSTVSQRLIEWGEPAADAAAMVLIRLGLELVPPAFFGSPSDETAAGVLSGEEAPIDGDIRGTSGDAEDEGEGQLPDGEDLRPDAETWQLRLTLRRVGRAQSRIGLTDLRREDADVATARRLQKEFGMSREELETIAAAEVCRAAQALPLLAGVPGIRLPNAPLAQVPDAFPLSAQDAVRFLRDWGPRLERLGFVVQIPSWLRDEVKRHLRLRVLARDVVKTPGLGHLGLDAITNVDAAVEVDGEALSLRELRAIMAHGEGLVPVHGGMVEVGARELRSLARVVEALGHRRPDGSLRVGDALALLAEGTGTDSGSDGEETSLDMSVEAEGYLRTLTETMRTGSPDLSALALPPIDGTHVAGVLRPYQADGARWLWSLAERGLGACLADDMGLGKTVQAIALLVGRRVTGRMGSAGNTGETVDRVAIGPERGGKRTRARARSSPAETTVPVEGEPIDDGRPRPTLLICPTSVLTNWQREIERFAPELRVHVQHGSGRDRSADRLGEIGRTVDVVLTSYALVWRDLPALEAIEWDGVILDEAQAVKNASTHASRAVRRLSSRYRLALTGTPIENRLEDLWSIFHFLNPGYLGSEDTFRRRFAVPVQMHRDAAQAALLHRLVAPFILRRLKTDVNIIRDLPPKLELHETCTLTREQARLYRQVVAELMRELPHADGMRRRSLISISLLRLKQILNHPAQYLRDPGPIKVERSGKMMRLVELVDEALSEGDRLLLFTQFVGFGDLVQPVMSQLCGASVPFLHGSTVRAARDEMIRRFQSGEGPPVLLLSLKAGGVGLNLTRANRVVHMDRWWNPAVENQATDRAHRIGQTERVMVHKMVTVGTVEERVDQMLEDKKQLAEIVVGGGEAWLTELSADALLDLVELRAEALEG